MSQLVYWETMKKQCFVDEPIVVPFDNRHIPGDSVDCVSAETHAYAASCALLAFEWPGFESFSLSIQYIDSQFSIRRHLCYFKCYLI